MDTGAPVNLTLGKIYDVLEEDFNFIYVTDDRGIRFGFLPCQFTKPAYVDHSHVHADLIHAWADGAIIQRRTVGGRFVDTHNNNPAWHIDTEYRVKSDNVIELERQIIAAETGITVAQKLLAELLKQLEQANA